MKLKLHTIGSLAIAAVFASACSDYLKEDSGDLPIPEKVSEFQAVLNGEGYPKTFAEDVAFTDLMTDNMTVMNGQSEDPNFAGAYDNITLSTGKGAYTWARDIEYYTYDIASAYENRYENILACNTIIENEETMIGSDSERNYCVAQAYALRAFNYFCLVNLYGLPYNKATAATDMGVAIRLSSEVTREEFTRSTVQQVYEQINKDLDRAIELFGKSTEDENIFQMSLKAALLLKTRVALYTENWDDAITYGEKLYATKLTLDNIGKLTPEEMMIQTQAESSPHYSFIKKSNPEILFNFGGTLDNPHKYISSFIAYIDGPSFATSQTNAEDLFNQYEEGDNRQYAFFMQDVTKTDGTMLKYIHTPTKHNSMYSRDCYKEAFRSAELFLNLAEAYIRKGGSENEAKGISLLNELRKSRFTADTYVEKTAADFASADDLLKFTWQERRRELCFDEMHRWFDLRREGMPRLVHKYRSAPNAAEETYVLEQGDKNYTLALPKSETNYNTKIEKYERRDINAQ